MELIKTIAELINNVGFPIVCFGLSAWYVKYREDKNDELIAKIVEAHNEENKRTIEAVNNNTLALQKLTDLLEKR